MKWFLVLLLVILAFGLGYGLHWWNAPLGCPLCLCDKGAAKLAPEYVQFWGYVKDYGVAIIAGVAVMGLALVGELYAIYQQVKALRDRSR